MKSLPYSDNIEELEQIDKVKSRVLKFVMYKKRTEAEIRNKFHNTFDEKIFEQVMEELKSLDYINDYNYIERAVNEFVALKNMSIKEIKFKLLSKGINSDDIENYISKNYDYLKEFEENSAKNIFLKKSDSMELIDIKFFLKKKGYMEESIKNAELIYTGDN